MQAFKPDEFLSPDETQKALEKLKAAGKKGHIIAGGTGFYELAKRGYVPEVKTIVSIMGLGLSYIDSGKEQLVVGATTSLQSLLEFGIDKNQGLEAIQDALEEIRPIQVRNVATVGGEVCISVPIVDLPTALLACDATLRIASDKGEYTMKLEEFYIDAFLTKLQKGELVKELIVPKPNSLGASSAFVKFGRTAYDFNLINCAASIRCDHSATNSAISSIRLFIGGIKRIPFRAGEIERKLLGQVPSEQIIFDACGASFSKINLLPSVHGSSEYKKAVLPTIVRDCIMRAYNRNLIKMSKAAKA